MAASAESGPAGDAPPQNEGDVESPRKSTAEWLPSEVAAAPEGGGKMLIVFLLLALFTANQWARSLIFYLVDFKAAPTAETAFLFMNVDVGFDEAQYGILASIGFAALFSATSLIAGGIVERVDTRNLLSGTAALWSAAVVWQGSAHSFGEVLGGRMLAGIGQAFSNPASYTILRRLYPPERLASVNGLYSSGIYFGGGLAALSVLIDQQLGWRHLSMAVGGVGLLAALAVQLLLPPMTPEPPGAVADLPAASPQSASQRSSRQALTSDVAATDALAADRPVAAEAAAAAPEGGGDLQVTSDVEETQGLLDSDDGSAVASGKPASGGAAPGAYLDQLQQLLSQPTVALLLAASAVRFLAGFTVGVWIVPFYRARFPGSIGGEFALIKAAVNGVAGSVSATGGGLLADNLTRRDPRFQLWVPAAGSLLAIPFWWGTISAPSLELSLGMLFLEYLVAECWFGPTVAGLQAAAPEGTGGLTTGLFSGLTLFGNLAPFFVGLAVQSGQYELSPLLLYSVSSLYLLSAVLFLSAAQTTAPLPPEAADDLT